MRHHDESRWMSLDWLELHLFKKKEKEEKSNLVYAEL